MAEAKYEDVVRLLAKVQGALRKGRIEQLQRKAAAGRLSPEQVDLLREVNVELRKLHRNLVKVDEILDLLDDE